MGKPASHCRILGKTNHARLTWLANTLGFGHHLGIQYLSIYSLPIYRLATWMSLPPRSRLSRVSTFARQYLS